MFVLPDNLPIELAPLAFLVGKWSGTGVIAFDGEEHEFTQTVEFAPDGSVLNYISSAKLMSGTETPLPSELGYWRVRRPRFEFDAGPGLLPGRGETDITSHESMDRFRAEHGGFDLEVSTIHPGGFAELYKGWVRQGRIELASEAGVAFEGAKVYRHSTRMYGLVEGALLWAWDIALPGQDLKSHASARLERVG